DSSFFSFVDDRLPKVVFRDHFSFRNESKQFFFITQKGMDVGHFRAAACQRTRFVEDNRIDFRQSFHDVSAFDEDTIPCSVSDSCNDGNWGGYNECPWTRNDKECQSHLDIACKNVDENRE